MSSAFALDQSKIWQKLHTALYLYRIDEKTGKPRQMQEVLGLNVLEYYNYFISTENDRLYLQENSNPRFYRQELASGQVFSASVDFAEKATAK